MVHSFWLDTKEQIEEGQPRSEPHSSHLNCTAIEQGYNFNMAGSAMLGRRDFSLFVLFFIKCLTQPFEVGAKSLCRFFQQCFIFSTQYFDNVSRVLLSLCCNII